MKINNFFGGKVTVQILKIYFKFIILFFFQNNLEKQTIIFEFRLSTNYEYL
jgi:hypothetical protein